MPPSYNSQFKKCQPVEQVEMNLKEFQDLLPIFKYIGRAVFIGIRNDFVIDSEAQLVCKYLKAYENELETTSSSKLWLYCRVNTFMYIIPTQHYFMQQSFLGVHSKGSNLVLLDLVNGMICNLKNVWKYLKNTGLTMLLQKFHEGYFLSK